MIAGARGGVARRVPPIERPSRGRPSRRGGIWISGICDILSRVIVLPQLLKRWDGHTIGIVGLGGMAVGLALLFCSAYIHSVFFIIGAVGCIVLGEGLFDPTYNTQLSLSVDNSKQGLLQGINQSLQALYRVIVPLGAGAIYTYNHGAVYGIAAFLLICGLVMFSRLRTI